MPTSRSAKKRVRQSEVRKLRNRSVRSNLRTHIKNCVKAIESGDLESARTTFRTMESRIDSAARKGVIHKNTASRRKARLAKRIQALASAS